MKSFTGSVVTASASRSVGECPPPRGLLKIFRSFHLSSTGFGAKAEKSIFTSMSGSFRKSGIFMVPPCPMKFVMMPYSRLICAMARPKGEVSGKLDAQ